MVESEYLYQHTARVRLTSFLHIHHTSIETKLRLEEAISRFDSSYTNLVMGTGGTDRNTLQKSEYQDVLFGFRCMRHAEHGYPCVDRNSSLYEATHAGLARMVLAYSSAVRDILSTPFDELSPDMDPFVLIQEVRVCLWTEGKFNASQRDVRAPQHIYLSSSHWPAPTYTNTDWKARYPRRTGGFQSTIPQGLSQRHRRAGGLHGRAARPPHGHHRD